MSEGAKYLVAAVVLLAIYLWIEHSKSAAASSAGEAAGAAAAAAGAAAAGAAANLNTATTAQLAALAANSPPGSVVGTIGGSPIDTVDAGLLSQGFQIGTVQYYTQLMQSGAWGGGLGVEGWTITDTLVPGSTEYGYQMNAWQAELNLYGSVQYSDMTQAQASRIGWGEQRLKGSWCWAPGPGWQYGTQSAAGSAYESAIVSVGIKALL